MGNSRGHSKRLHNTAVLFFLPEIWLPWQHESDVSIPVRPCCSVFDWRETPWMSGRDHQLCGGESGATALNDTRRLVHIYLPFYNQRCIKMLVYLLRALWTHSQLRIIVAFATVGGNHWCSAAQSLFGARWMRIASCCSLTYFFLYSVYTKYNFWIYQTSLYDCRKLKRTFNIRKASSFGLFSGKQKRAFTVKWSELGSFHPSDFDLVTQLPRNPFSFQRRWSFLKLKARNNSNLRVDMWVPGLFTLRTCRLRARWAGVCERDV